ncbi:MAG: hypothetical protein H7174_06080 [Flavobacterium sp.]|nr:hypothetical protein [Flavobacterium sp.]
MNRNIIFLGILFLLGGIVNSQAQVKTKPKSIISTTASIKTYYDKAALDAMQKGELIGLYQERMKLLVFTMPYIALANKPGTTMTDIGIPDTSENRKGLDVEQENSGIFLNGTVDFLSKMLPYADKSSLVTSILFYENVLRELHVMNE